tara:strand:+ start:1498 stop:3147 length:1650 start_codon:yes stop_codon:yes gene_type:complete
MTINISIQDVGQNLHPKITVLGVGGSGGNAINNMIDANLEGVDFLIANTDAQALQISKCQNKIQLGLNSTKGLGAGMRPDIGKKAAEEAIQDLNEKFEGSHMLFIAAGMGGGTGTGAAPIIAKLAREKGILTVGVVTKPFHFEGTQRMKLADKGIEELQQHVDTLLTIPNQNLFRIANEKTTFSDAFKMADDVLYAGVRGVTDLMVQPGMINLDFSDIKTVMSEMGKAMMGTGEASGEGRAIAAAEAAIANPLIDDVSLKGAKGLIINISGGKDITLYEVDEAANRIKQEVDEEANIIYGTTCDERLEGLVRVSIVATGIEANSNISAKPIENFAPISLNNEVYKEQNEETAKVIVNDNDNSQSKNENLYQNENFEDSFQESSSEKKEVNIENNEQLYESHSIDSQLNTSTLDQEISNKDEEIIEEESINDLPNEISLNYDENKENSSQEVIKNNSVETNVRRLSLFDTISDEKTKLEENQSTEERKSEPVINNNDLVNDSNDPEMYETHDNAGSEFNPEDNDQSEEDFNQETEEELLDIPTFLRRQAN